MQNTWAILNNSEFCNNDKGDPGSHCGRRHKYQMGKGKKEPCGWFGIEGIRESGDF